jgi:hypothetical protein
MLLGTSKMAYGKKKTVSAILYCELVRPGLVKSNQPSFRPVANRYRTLTQVCIHASNLGVANISSVKEADDIEESQHGNEPIVDLAEDSTRLGVLVIGLLDEMVSDIYG